MQESETIDLLLEQYDKATSVRRQWESLWEECYNYTFPGRRVQSFSAGAGAGTGGGSGGGFEGGGSNIKEADNQIYDSTAPDSAEQLASGLLGELTPPFGKWLELYASDDYMQHYGPELQVALDEARDVFHEHLQKSNFLLEMQQAFLDSVVVGTSVMSFTENTDMADSAFRFSALPLHQVYVGEGSDGRLSRIFRRSDYSLADLRVKFPELDEAAIERLSAGRDSADADDKFAVIEAVSPCADNCTGANYMDTGGQEEGYDYHAILQYGSAPGQASLLRSGHYRHNPFIAFRWLKVPGESYGRSPIMKLLPDIRTANKVVELILKNAAIAVTGIWQADDDGVLNPSNIKLAPGTIIPKAVGSKGLTPLQPSADFKLSQVVLDQLREQIRNGLLYYHLSPDLSPVATATEVLERSSRTSRLLAAVYGRMQSELLMPLVYRGLHILKRRGLIAPMPIDGINVRVRIQSPLARQQNFGQVQNALQFIDYASRLHLSFPNQDTSQMLSWMAQQMEIPRNILPQDILSDAQAAEIISQEPNESVSQLTLINDKEQNHA